MYTTSHKQHMKSHRYRRDKEEHKRVVISGDQECDLHLTCNNIYLLCGRVCIRPGVKLLIDPGTVIEVERNVEARLVVEQGAHICAEGTKDKPIIFTSAELCPQAGDWGGITLDGYSPISLPLNPLQICDSRCRISDSGIFKYVRIEYAGAIPLDYPYKSSCGSEHKLDHDPKYNLGCGSYHSSGGLKDNRGGIKDIGRNSRDTNRYTEDVGGIEGFNLDGTRQNSSKTGDDSYQSGGLDVDNNLVYTKNSIYGNRIGLHQSVLDEMIKDQRTSGYGVYGLEQVETGVTELENVEGEDAEYTEGEIQSSQSPQHEAVDKDHKSQSEVSKNIGKQSSTHYIYSQHGAGLSLNGVTDQTVLENVQVSYSSSDAFYFSGGDVNGKHLLAYKPRAAGFRLARGYRGHLQFIMSIHSSSHEHTYHGVGLGTTSGHGLGGHGLGSKTVGGQSVDPKIVGGHGGTGTPNLAHTGAAGVVFQQEPYLASKDIPVVDQSFDFLLLTTAVVSHATLIGPLESNASSSGDGGSIGVMLQSGSLGEIHNSIISGWDSGLVCGGLLDNDLISNQDIQLQSNIFGAVIPIFFCGVTEQMSRYRIESLNAFNAFLAIPDIFTFFCEDCYVPKKKTTLNTQTAYYSSGLMDPFFEVVKYRGAFASEAGAKKDKNLCDSPDWTQGWVEYVSI